MYQRTNKKKDVSTKKSFLCLLIWKAKKKNREKTTRLLRTQSNVMVQKLLGRKTYVIFFFLSLYFLLQIIQLLFFLRELIIFIDLYESWKEKINVAIYIFITLLTDVCSTLFLLPQNEVVNFYVSNYILLPCNNCC